MTEPQQPSASSAADAAASSFLLDAETFRKISPIEYHRRFITEGIRPDERPLQHARKFNVLVGSIKTAYGSAQVRLGDTIVTCGIKAEITEPKVLTPNQGFLVPNIDLPPICSPKFKPGPPSDLTQSMSELLDQTVKSANIIDLQDLCISEGKAVWVLYADIICLNYDGNVFDAALAALVAALKNVRLPEAKYYETEGVVKASEERTKPLVLNRSPVSVTFGIFDG
ncbi:hypothetical protein HK102_006827, partial [Quaeritorhiza haematococci]